MAASGVDCSAGAAKWRQADTEFYKGKVAACQFFYRYHLPQAAEKLRYVASQDRSVPDPQASWFTGV